MQLVLDIVGLIPAVGEIADAINGVIYLLRGDMLSAGLSFAACIPFAGWAATGGKLLGKGAKLLDKIGDLSKIVDKVKDLSKYLDKAKDIGKTILKYGDNALNFAKKKGDDLFGLLSNNKLAEKAMGVITKLSQKAVDINSFLEKQVNKVSASLGEWWGKQCQMGIVPPDVAAWINRNVVEEVGEELGEEVIEEITKEITEHVGGKELENQVGEDISKGAGNTIEGGSKTPSEIAESWQGSGKYPGVDNYKNITIKKDTVIYRGEPNGTEYFTTKSAVERSGEDATKIFEGLQVEKNPIHGYRGTMQGYKFNEDVAAAFGITKANPQFGKGGLPQIFVPDVRDLISKGVLVPVDSIPLIK